MSSQLQRSRDLAFHRQDGRCFYCSIVMSPPTAPRRDRLRCTSEHLHLRSDGGSNALYNIVAACAHCNHTRHKRKRPPAPSGHRAEVRRRIGQMVDDLRRA